MTNNAFAHRLEARFKKLDDLDFIKRAVTKVPTERHDITTIPAYQIKRRIGDLLSELYVPTTQDLALLRKVVHAAKAHCNVIYQSDQQYLEGLYTPHDAFTATPQFPICLTGPAGVGKTSLLSAMQRLLPAPSELDIGSQHDAIPIQSHWHVQVKGRTSFPELVAPFIQSELGGDNKRPRQSLSITTKKAFKSGVSLFLLDELQFLTQSASANTSVTKLLLQVSYIGIPFVFCANYSLCRLLLRRNEQDRQRLLSCPVVLTPSGPDSADWANYLSTLQRVLGESLRLDLHSERHTIYHLTAGLKRLVVQLLKSAYELAWQNAQHYVTRPDIEAAYNHTEYAVSREQAQAMLAPHTIKSSAFTCPFPLPKIEAEELLRLQKRKQYEAIMEDVQRDSLSKSERKAQELIKQNNAPKAPKAPKRKKLTVDELLQNHARRLNSSSER